MEGILGPSPSGSTARLRSFSRPALTLMELLVVVAIIAVLAGLLIPKIDWARRQANMAVAASSSADVASYIQMYIPSTDGLPNGFDSLVGTDGLIYGGPTGNTGVTCGQGGIIGILDGVGSISSSTAATNIPATDKRWNSLFRMGLTVLNDHSLASTNATDSATVLSSLGTITNGTATYSDGRRAQLKTVIDSFGRTIDSALSNFNTAGPDDLPPGGPYVRITPEVSPSQP